MIIARMDLGPVFRGMSWFEVVSFLVGAVSVVIAIVFFIEQSQSKTRGSRFGIAILSVAALVGLPYLAWAIVLECGAAPSLWVTGCGRAWLWGVGLLGGGMGITSLQRADPVPDQRHHS